nr:hypothetical protein [Tanacetum cinerariifolium]
MLSKPSRGFLMLSKTVEKTTHVSLVLDFTSGPSSGVRAAPSRDRQDPLNPGLICMRTVLTKNRCTDGYLMLVECGPVGGAWRPKPSGHIHEHVPIVLYQQSVEDSDDLNIPDAAPVDPILEAGALPKFSMRLYRSSLNESHVRYLVKLYGIPEELHPLVVPEGMTMNALPPGAIGLYAHHFQQGGLGNRAEKDCKPCLKDAPTSLKKWNDKFFLVDRRAAPIAMAWRHHESSVADPFPRPDEYNASDHAGRAFSIKDSEGNVIIMAKFLRLHNFKGCKVAAGTLLPLGAARVTHLASPAARLEDILPKTGDMIMAKIPCRKVFDDKEKKKRNAKEKAATKAPAINIQAEAAVDKPARREGPHKKSRVCAGAQAPFNSKHVSSPTPLNQAKPLEALANEEHVSPPLLVDAVISWRSLLSRMLCRMRRLANSSRMDNSRECRDMTANLFTPTDEEFFNDGVRDESAIRRFWKLLCQSTQQQANVLLRFETLKEQHADLVYVHESCTDVKARYKECWRNLQDRLEELEEEKKETENLNSSQVDWIRQLEEALKQVEADAEQLRAEKVHFAVEAGKGEIVRQKTVNQYLPTFVRWLHQSADTRGH